MFSTRWGISATLTFVLIMILEDVVKGMGEATGLTVGRFLWISLGLMVGLFCLFYFGVYRHKPNRPPADSPLTLQQGQPEFLKRMAGIFGYIAAGVVAIKMLYAIAVLITSSQEALELPVR